MILSQIYKGGIKMTPEELKEQLDKIQKIKCETQNLELKSAEHDCPKRLFDTLSSFSNQDEGGIIIFGIDESQDYKEVGVYDPQDIQKKIIEHATANDIMRLAKTKGTVTMRQDGILKALSGITTMEEVNRVASDLS